MGGKPWQVEEVWKKALVTYDTNKSGIDPIGEYVVAGTTKTYSSDNFSDNGHELELAIDVEGATHDDPPDSTGNDAQEGKKIASNFVE